MAQTPATITVSMDTIEFDRGIMRITDKRALILVDRDPEHEPDTEGHIPADVLEALADLAAPTLDKPVSA